jgi:alpha-L-rhamnosidase
MNRTAIRLLFPLLMMILCISCEESSRTSLNWPSVTHETKPWTRWWWQGSAVTKEGITAELEAYKAAGLGGVEITPIYGVYGEEESFINYLSPQWMDMLVYTLKEADRLDLGVDMATGTGWPFGGPWVHEADACKNMNYHVYHLAGGESIQEPILFHQGPLVRSVGTQVYELHGILKVPGQTTQGTVDEPLMRRNTKPLEISQLVEPVEANKNLQALALDQVKFDKQLRPSVVMAYSAQGEKINLTSKIDSAGKLDWIAPEGRWNIYAIFPGSHGKMVERAAPGGEGNVIDHFSSQALTHYLNRFDSAFRDRDVKSLRAFFNDSYEVDDARGTADWTPDLFEEFIKRRGYDLREQLPALFALDSAEKNERVLCDYRETISELIHDNFTAVWRSWAERYGKIVRNQAHGSPANILDLYAEVDIPEIEGNEALRIKMASSAAHVTGKRLTSSESATWLNEHFLSNLSDIKKAVDLFLVNGVNHIFYHGTCYSPPDEPWPGRLFYASVHLNPRNSLWKDFGKLNAYVARSQSFLQEGEPANDVLLYFPIYDRFSSPGREMLEHFDGVGQFDGAPFKEAAEEMMDRGYSFDYISDKQIRALKVEDGNIVSAGHSRYKTIVIPHCRYIPLETMEALIKLSEEGATIVVYKGLPDSFSGFADLDQKQKAFDDLLASLKFSEDPGKPTETARQGSGRLIRGEYLESLLTEAGLQREVMVDGGLQYIRKGNDNGIYYFITNWGDMDYEGWLGLATEAASAMLFDPMFDKSGLADVRQEDGHLSVYIQLKRGQSMIIQTTEGMFAGSSFPYVQIDDNATAIAGPWKLSFIDGGPVLPGATALDTLGSWTAIPDSDAIRFSGTARYETSIQVPPGQGGGFLLDLGQVRETARVFLNGNYLETLIGPSYTLYIERQWLHASDTLEIEVSNLMANRIADLDRRGVFWKRFYNVNFPARLARNRKEGLFSAADWRPRESGLMGPVTLRGASVPGGMPK